MVDEPRLVQAAHQLQHLFGVELAPALVENHPQSDAGAVIKLLYHVGQLRAKLLPRLLVSPPKEGVELVAQMPSSDQRGRDDKGTVVPAAAGHILPDQHAEPVTVVIPAQGLHLDVLAQHVEAAVFGRLNVKDQGLVRRRGVEPVRPVALVQQAVLEIGLAV